MIETLHENSIETGLRNDTILQNFKWRDIGDLLMRIAGIAQNWIILCPGNLKDRLSANLKDRLSAWIRELKKITSRPGRITG